MSTTYLKTFRNTTDLLAIFAVTMRDGETDVTKDAETFPVDVPAKSSVVVPLPNTNHGSMPFINAVAVFGVGNPEPSTPAVVRAKTRSDAADRLMNTNNTLVVSLSGNTLSLTGSNAGIALGDNNEIAVSHPD